MLDRRSKIIIIKSIKPRNGVFVSKPIKMPPFVEFVTLMACLSALGALAIDAILPALPLIGQTYGITEQNNLQYLVSCLILGMGIGQIFYGPFSDHFGRRYAIYLGLTIFLVGSLLSAFAPSYFWMLCGRVLQGIGIAGPRVTTVAIVRDQFEGRKMARVMSFIFGTFVLVPALAPAVGQLIMNATSWYAIFYFFFAFGAVLLAWFSLRCPETLTDENKVPFSFKRIIHAATEVCKHRATLSYTMVSGFVFAALVVYISTVQAIFADTFNITEDFPLYFAILSLGIGTANFTNASLVMRLGMRLLSTIALLLVTIGSFGALLYGLFVSPIMPLIPFMCFMLLMFFAMGLLFGNVNAMAMEPMGHMAGIASAVIGSITSFVAMIAGSIVGHFYDETHLSLFGAFFCFGFLALLMLRYAMRQSFEPATP